MTKDHRLSFTEDFSPEDVHCNVKFHPLSALQNLKIKCFTKTYVAQLPVLPSSVCRLFQERHQFHKLAMSRLQRMICNIKLNYIWRGKRVQKNRLELEKRCKGTAAIESMKKIFDRITILSYCTCKGQSWPWIAFSLRPWIDEILCCDSDGIRWFKSQRKLSLNEVCDLQRQKLNLTDLISVHDFIQTIYCRIDHYKDRNDYLLCPIRPATPLNTVNVGADPKFWKNVANPAVQLSTEGVPYCSVLRPKVNINGKAELVLIQILRFEASSEVQFHMRFETLTSFNSTRPYVWTKRMDLTTVIKFLEYWLGYWRLIEHYDTATSLGPWFIY